MNTNYRAVCGCIALALFGVMLVWCGSCSDNPCGPDRSCPSPAPIYHNEFSEVPGAEWSVQERFTSPTGAQFLGRFARQTVQLSLSDLPGHTSLTLAFKLFIIHSWDGNANAGDYWKCSVYNGPVLLYATFSNISSYQSYPGICGACSNCYPKAGASAVDTLEIAGPYSNRGDAIYDIVLTFPHNSSSVVIEFQGLTDEGLDNESWGIDDVYLWKGPPELFPEQ